MTKYIRVHACCHNNIAKLIGQNISDHNLCTLGYFCYLNKLTNQIIGHFFPLIIYSKCSNPSVGRAENDCVHTIAAFFISLVLGSTAFKSKRR